MTEELNVELLRQYAIKVGSNLVMTKIEKLLKVYDIPL